MSYNKLSKIKFHIKIRLKKIKKKHEKTKIGCILLNMGPQEISLEDYQHILQDHGK